MKANKFYIIDFDSTFTQVEALDELANICLQDHTDKLKIEQEIKSLTTKAMEGSLAFDQALKLRIDLLPIHRNHIEALIAVLKTKVSTSFKNNRNFLSENANNIYIISGGFKDFILPVVIEYGLLESHVLANEFCYDHLGKIIGYDVHNFLAQHQGKIKQVAALQLQGEINVIGDGYTDYEIKESGLANYFYLFTENIHRHQLDAKADKIIQSLDEIIH